MGGTESDVGFTEFVKKRLEMECRRLLPIQKHVSLMIDEVAIHPSFNFLKNTDQYIGHADLGDMDGPNERDENKNNKNENDAVNAEEQERSVSEVRSKSGKRLVLANKVVKLLTFATNGFSTPYTIPVAYFRGKSLFGENLNRLTTTVLKELDQFTIYCPCMEEHVLFIENLSTNVKLFKLLNDGQKKFTYLQAPF